MTRNEFKAAISKMTRNELIGILCDIYYTHASDNDDKGGKGGKSGCGCDCDCGSGCGSEPKKTPDKAKTKKKKSVKNSKASQKK